MRIGVVGTENSHVDHFIRFLNTEQRHGPARVVALAGGRSERNLGLAAAASIDTVVESATDLLGHVDAAIISSRDGRTHRDQAVPLLAAGLPVLVDKPLAASVEDATAIIDAAAQGSAVLVSASAMRFAPEIDHLAARPAGAPDAVFLTGPADPDSEYAGLFFYGIHHVEAALQLTGDGDAGDVHVQRSGRSIVATTVVNGVHVVLTFVVPREGEQIGFHATVVGAKGARSSDLTLGRDYNAPVLARFIAAAEGGAQAEAQSPQALLAPVRLLESIARAVTGAAAVTGPAA